MFIFYSLKNYLNKLMVHLGNQEIFILYVIIARAFTTIFNLIFLNAGFSRKLSIKGGDKVASIWKSRF